MECRGTEAFKRTSSEPRIRTCLIGSSRRGCAISANGNVDDTPTGPSRALTTKASTTPVVI